MRITRYFTKAGQSPYHDIPFHSVQNPAVKRNIAESADGFSLDGTLIVPAQFSQNAVHALAENAFCSAPIPAKLKKRDEKNIPRWLQASVADIQAAAAAPEEPYATREKDARQIFNRLAGAWTYWGFKSGCFDSEEDARAFHDEICFMLATQRAAPDKAQWSATGLHWAYGLEKSAAKGFCSDVRGETLHPVSYAYERPQVYHYCLRALSENSDEHNDTSALQNAILESWQQQAGFVTGELSFGSNISALPEKGETQESALKLMPFIQINAAIAKAASIQEYTKPATMMVLNADHPDIESYIDWQQSETYKYFSLQTGKKVAEKHIKALLCAGADFHAAAGDSDTYPKNARYNAEEAFCPQSDAALKAAVQAAENDSVPAELIQQVLQFARQGFRHSPFTDSSLSENTHKNSAAEINDNLPMRALSLPESFLRAVENNADWQLLRRSDGTVHTTLKARFLWDKIAVSAWSSSAPHLHFQTGINDWHTAPAAGEIRSSDSRSEYFFADNTACPLAQINLAAFLQKNQNFDCKAFMHSVRLWVLVLEITQTMGQFPSETIARTSKNYRPVALSCSNFAAMLQTQEIAYDSDAARSLCAAVIALMTGTGYATSAELASTMGAFKSYARNAQTMLRVMRNHRRAAYGHFLGYEQLHIAPMPLNAADCPLPDIVETARAIWDTAIQNGEIYGFRHAHISLLAADTTAERIMDCEAYGILPCSSEKHTVSTESCIRMTAAAQPFLSGGISQEFTMPAQSSVADCAKSYMFAWKLGLKAVALRCENTAAPIFAHKDNDDAVSTPAFDAALTESLYADDSANKDMSAEAEYSSNTNHLLSNAEKNIVITGDLQRETLPGRRKGWTQKAVIGGHKIFLRTGEFKDGRLGEIFIDTQKEGSSFAALMQNFAVSVSLGLQYGVPLEAYVNSFVRTKFIPEGVVHGSDAIKHSSSVLDYIFRELAVSYLDRVDLSNNELSDTLHTSLHTIKKASNLNSFSEHQMPGLALQSNITAEIPNTADIAVITEAKSQKEDFNDIIAASRQEVLVANEESNNADTVSLIDIIAAEANGARDFIRQNSEAQPDAIGYSGIVKELPELQENIEKSPLSDVYPQQKPSAHQAKPRASYAKMPDVIGLKQLMPFSDLSNQSFAMPHSADKKAIVQKTTPKQQIPIIDSLEENTKQSDLENSLLYELFGDEAADTILAQTWLIDKPDTRQNKNSNPHEKKTDDSIKKSGDFNFSSSKTESLAKSVFSLRKKERKNTLSDRNYSLHDTLHNASFTEASSAEEPISAGVRESIMPQNWTTILCPKCHNFITGDKTRQLKCTHCGFVSANFTE